MERLRSRNTLISTPDPFCFFYTTVLGEGPGIYFDLKDIKEMYERWTVGDGNGIKKLGGSNNTKPDAQTTLANNATISTLRLPTGVAGAHWTTTSSVAAENDYILFVHGWNMHAFEKDWFAETAFKRLYWQGYRGRFGAFQWPTTFHEDGDDLAAIWDYDDGEYTAWRSSVPLKNLFYSLHQLYGDHINVLAHSMGNVVTGEALRLAAQQGLGPIVKAYVASQAAVPGHCYDGGLTGGDLMDFSFIVVKGVKESHLDYGPDTPNIYNDWLTPNNGAVTNKMNFNNRLDYALDVWQTDQKLKPDDRRATYNSNYNYTGADIAVIEDKFTATTIATGVVINLHLGDATTVIDRYEIMAYAAEPRSLPLGAIPAVSGFTPLELNTIWPADKFEGGDYRSHPWHSAQFRFTNMDQSNYWRILLGSTGFNIQLP